MNWNKKFNFNLNFFFLFVYENRIAHAKALKMSKSTIGETAELGVYDNVIRTSTNTWVGPTSGLWCLLLFMVLCFCCFVVLLNRNKHSSLWSCQTKNLRFDQTHRKHCWRHASRSLQCRRTFLCCKFVLKNVIWFLIENN